MYGGSASRNQTSQNGDQRSQKEETRGLYHRHTPEVSTPGEPLSSHEREVGVVASLLLPHTPPRTLRPVHETRGASLHMLGEVLWHLVQFGIISSTEECDPEVLLHVTKRWRCFHSLPHSTGRTLSAFADFCQNKWSTETSNPPHEACESHTLSQTEITCQEVRQLLRGYPLGSSGESSSRTHAW